MKHDEIAVIDFGGQYAHLIATKVRRHGVLAEIRQPEDPIEAFEGFKGIIISGSPSLASHGEDSEYTHAIYDLDVPIIGFCFGHQEIARHYDGEVIHGGREWGKVNLHLTGEHPLFAGLGPVEQVFMSHYDSIASVGADFQELGYSKATEGSEGHRFAAIGSDTLRRYGLQFHPEVDDTVHGDRMIANFVLDICECKPSWTMEGYVDETSEHLREQVGEGSVFLLASGGVDSTVAAALIASALGPDHLQLLHIDNGLMRENESAEVVEYFKEIGLGENLAFVDATEDFLSALEGVIGPEEKRRIIGDTFIEVFNREAERLGIPTIYSDRELSTLTPLRLELRSGPIQLKPTTTAFQSSRNCSKRAASLNLSLSSTRWKCVSLARSSVSPTSSYTGTRFPVLDSVFGCCATVVMMTAAASTKSSQP